jgi:hypothetical protein
VKNRRKNMTFAAIFAIIIGILMIAQWTISILKKQVAGPEIGLVGRGRTEMAFHWVAEFSTAVLLLISGFGLILNTGWGLTVFLIATGMLIYTVINSPGYFAQQRKWPMIIMFAVILVLAIVSLILVIRA